MGQRASKHAEVKTVTPGLDGGINLHNSPATIADNQMTEAKNFYYAEKGEFLVTRPGVKLVTQARIGEVLLTVVLHPAQGGWRVVGSTEWLASGSSLSLTPGATYGIEYQDVDGYRTPGGSTVVLTDNTIIEATYRLWCMLDINLSLPNEVINPVVDVAGVEAVDVLSESTRTLRKFKAVADTYDITYESVPWYVSPDDETIALTSNMVLTRAYYDSVLQRGFSGIAYGNGIYVGVTQEELTPGVYSGVVYTSPNGVVWTKVYTLPAPTTNYFSSDMYVAFGSGVFVLAGKTENRHIVASSTDGVGWVERATLSTAYSAYSKDVIFCNGLFFTSGANYGGGLDVSERTDLGQELHLPGRWQC